MLLVLCTLSAAGTLFVLGRWVFRGVDALGRRRDFPAFGSALLVALTVLTGVPVWRHANFERQLADVASTLAATPVAVRCETLSQAWTQARPEAGYVRFDASGRPEPLATITVETCDDLRAWARSDHVEPTLDQVIAVHVLTHEAMHLAGHQDEGVTECAAVQRDVRTATLLGATAAQGRALAVRYWQEVYPRLPDNYRTGDCGAGRRLDEGLDDPPWAKS